jgi:hypothetical protein
MTAKRPLALLADRRPCLVILDLMTPTKSEIEAPAAISQWHDHCVGSYRAGWCAIRAPHEKG